MKIIITERRVMEIPMEATKDGVSIGRFVDMQIEEALMSGGQVMSAGMEISPEEWTAMEAAFKQRGRYDDGKEQPHPQGKARAV